MAVWAARTRGTTCACSCTCARALPVPVPVPVAIPVPVPVPVPVSVPVPVPVRAAEGRSRAGQSRQCPWCGMRGARLVPRQVFGGSLTCPAHRLWGTSGLPWTSAGFLKTNVLGGVRLLPPSVISRLEVIFQVRRQERLGGDSLRAVALRVLYFLLLYGALYCLIIGAVKHLAAWDSGGVLHRSWAEGWCVQSWGGEEPGCIGDLWPF